MDGQNQEEQNRIRAAFYIDGFNLYHAIDELRQPHLKWISYTDLAKILIPQRSQEIVGVTWCTAYYPKDPQKKWRHEQLVGAQKCHGVEVVEGHFVHEQRDCRGCKRKWKHPTEKEGDINVALRLIRDAFNNFYDHAYLALRIQTKQPRFGCFEISSLKSQLPLLSLLDVRDPSIGQILLTAVQSK